MIQFAASSTLPVVDTLRRRFEHNGHKVTSNTKGDVENIYVNGQQFAEVMDAGRTVNLIITIPKP